VKQMVTGWLAHRQEGPGSASFSRTAVEVHSYGGNLNLPDHREQMENARRQRFAIGRMSTTWNAC
jgi:hypothetical protein